MECNRSGLSGALRLRECAMRLPFGRAGKDTAGPEELVARTAIATPAPAAPGKPAAASESGDLDLRALGQALARNRGWVIVPTVLAAVLSIAAVTLVTPRYQYE